MRQAMVAMGLALALGGCSLVLDPGRHMGDAAMDSATPDADADVPTLDVNNVCSAMASVFCEGRSHCCSMGAPSNCVAEATDKCERWLGPVLLEPNTHYNPERGAELLERARAAAAEDSCSDDIIALVAERDGLISAMDGTFGDGEACEANTGDLLIDAVARLFTCTEGYGCRNEMSGWVCRPLSGMNEDCSKDFECQQALYCGELTNQCVERRDITSGCDRAWQCQSLYCDMTDMTCADPDQDTVWCADPFDILPMPTTTGM